MSAEIDAMRLRTRRYKRMQLLHIKKKTFVIAQSWVRYVSAEVGLENFDVKQLYMSDMQQQIRFKIFRVGCYRSKNKYIGNLTSSNCRNHDRGNAYWAQQQSYMSSIKCCYQILVFYVLALCYLCGAISSFKFVHTAKGPSAPDAWTPSCPDNSFPKGGLQRDVNE